MLKTPIQYLIKVALDNDNVACNGTQVVQRLLVTDITRTDNLLDLARHL